MISAPEWEDGWFVRGVERDGPGMGARGRGRGAGRVVWSVGRAARYRRAGCYKAAFFREARTRPFPSIAVIDNAVHDTLTARARPICRHKSLETKTYPRGHANLPTPDRR